MGYLPQELVRETILYSVDSYPVDLTSKSRRECPCAKCPWESVKSLLRVSHAVREAALDAWFRVFRVKAGHSRNFRALSRQWPRLKLDMRVKEIQIDGTEAKSGTTWDLSAFPQLRAVRIVMVGRTDTLPLGGVPSSVRELHLSTSVCTLQMCLDIVRVCPQLRVLTLDGDFVCPMCDDPAYHPASSKFRDLPPVVVYEGGVGMPKNYAAHLKGLQELHTVYFSMRYDSRGKYGIGKKSNLWSGECSTCVDGVRKDTERSKTWAEEKLHYTRPPALRTVIWNLSHAYPRAARMSAGPSKPQKPIPWGRLSWGGVLQPVMLPSEGEK